jgi:acyl-coenzyme A synthetase/AMP-(fatty) acid ligase
MKSDSWNDVIRHTQPRLILMNSEREEDFAPVLKFGLSEDSRAFEDSFSARIAELNPVAELPDVSEEQEAVILFTSGSTGRPKGIALSHGALYRTSQILDRAYKWRSADRFLSAGAFHTMSGLRNPCIAVLHSGASIVVPAKEDLQNPLGLLGLCVNYEVTILNVTPGFLAYWGRAAQKTKYFHSHKLRMVLSTGFALQPVQREVFGKQFGVPIYDYYGLTETTGACILETEEITKLEEKGIGKPWDCIAKICEDGELAIYSENLMLGYLQDPAATARRIQNGWLMTGDIARVNDSGCIVLIGRKDRMMKDKQGELVYPEQIESAISAIDQIADVYVTSYPDELEVNQIAAMIKVHAVPDDVEKLFSAIRAELSKRISPSHIPVFMMVVPEMPVGAGGKITGESVRNLILQEIKRRRKGSGSSNAV